MLTASHRARVTSRRPPAVVATIVILWFLGLSAVGGGIGLLFDIGMRQDGMLDQIPLLNNWVLPGLVLGLGFGVGSLVTAYGVTHRPDWAWMGWVGHATRHHWSWLFTGLLGIGMMAWIGMQFLWLEPSFLHPIYGTVGVSLLALASSPSFRDDLRIET